MDGAAGRTNTRSIARAAVRAELAQVAFDLFLRDGFEKVTLDDLASAAGVSRSTFLRYFGSKEDAALSVFESHGEQVADAVRARPSDEDDWTALRRGLDAAIEHYRRDPVRALRTTRFVLETPALCARQLEKQRGWWPTLTQALAERTDPPQPVTLAVSVKAAAALDCLNIALDHWTASDGHLDLVDLLDEAFSALTPR
ncbi:TetR/AcrR family transcriptional regulator [Streptomyces sp. NPDC047042]|uniref:TetR/AcrR family transcriptional regulator n=1 Tax=Streptomyces sp. NPDC047042 TaxID=3154807 RepID=UPI0033E455CF